MDISGRIKAIFETQKINERFSKREFVLTIDENSPYPQHITFQLIQDRCTLIDNFSIGDEIKVYFTLKGREWKSPEGQIKYFNTIEAWKIEKINSNPIAPNNSNNSHSQSFTPVTNPIYEMPQKPEFDNSEHEINDLPF